MGDEVGVFVFEEDGDLVGVAEGEGAHRFPIEAALSRT